MASDAGVEIFFSSLTKSQAKLDVPNPGGNPNGRDGMKYPIPEAGWGNSDNVLTIKRLLWCKVYPEEEIPPAFEAYHNDKLDWTLAIRHKKGEHPYLAVKTPKTANPVKTKVYSKLKTELPNLNFIIVYTDYNSPVFVVSEPKMEAGLIEFFRNKPE